MQKEYRFEQVIDEHFDFKRFATEVRSIFDATKQPVRLNCKGVTRINSIGVTHLIQQIIDINVPLVYSQVPTCLVAQLNMLQDFFHVVGTTVESLEVPLYNTETDEVQSKWIQIAEDIPAHLPIDEIEETLLDKWGDEYEAEFMGESYFEFLEFMRHSKVA